MDRLNTGREYFGLGKIQVGYVSGFGKIRAVVFRLYRFRVDLMGIGVFFVSHFLFVEIKDSTYLKLEIIHI